MFAMRSKALLFIPTYRLVDTCAAEFEAFTPYYYSTYGIEDEVRDNDRKKVMILGGGPNRIGQGIEFDYCCVHASFALRELGYETIMVNSNPETVSTDYDTSDKLYFEPLTLEDVLNIYERENVNDQVLGVIVQFGGQTPLNLAKGLEENGVRIIGTSPKNIELAEDRKMFAKLLDDLGLHQAPSGTATSLEEALAITAKIGYPSLVRPSFVLGGRAMQIVYSDAELTHYMKNAVEATPDRPVLVDRFLEDATEVDVDCISDGETTVIGAIMEHIEEAGIHSGDSACVIPPFSLTPAMQDRIRDAAKKLAKALNVRGLMNMQLAVKGDDLYVIEVNPRASRTAPFVSKAIGVPLPKLAAKIMAGKTLKELGFTEEVIPKHHSVKEAVFPFSKFTGVDIILGPEMKSTGEVMGIDYDLGMAFAKSQMAAGGTLPTKGNVFISVKETDRPNVVRIAKGYADLGFTLYATSGTGSVISEAGIPVNILPKLASGQRPNVIDLMKNKDMALVINTPSGKNPREDEVKIRTAAMQNRIPIMTTLRGADAALRAIKSLQGSEVQVRALQEYHCLFEGKVLHEVFRWNDPRVLARGFVEDMENASGGQLKFDVVEWRDLDEIYARNDGGRFTVEEYVRNRRAGTGWPAKYNADYPRIMAEQKVVPMIDTGRVDEVWIFSDHFFGLFEASMAGPGAFFINGGVYPQVPSKRPFAFYGFNYQRGVAEMMHDVSHRTECHMNRIYGEWNLKNPQNNWEKFSANNTQSNGVAGVGTCHWPANAMSGYDYGNLRLVDSWADDFLNYPNLTGQTKKVSFATWSEKGGDHHRNYMKWYFAHLPRAEGVNPDGRLNNWWRYIFDFGNYTRDGRPLPSKASFVSMDTQPTKTVLQLAYTSPLGILPSSFDPEDVTLAVEGGEELHPSMAKGSDERPGGYRVASYHFPLVDSVKLGQSVLKFHASQVFATDGMPVPPAEWTLVEAGGNWEASPMSRDRSNPRQIAEWVLSIGGKVGIVGKPGLVDDSSGLTGAESLKIEQIILSPLLKDVERLQFADLMPLRILNEIRTLNTRGAAFGDKGAHWIASTFPLLTSLNLHACELTDESMAALATLTDLEHLDIGYSRGKITDAGAAQLSSLQKLKRLNIYGSAITDRTLIEVFAKLPALESVEVLGTKVTDDGAEAFKKLNPKCRLVGLSKN
jgi:carbamoylphosphate synthase large subunit